MANKTKQEERKVAFYSFSCIWARLRISCLRSVAGISLSLRATSSERDKLLATLSSSSKASLLLGSLGCGREAASSSGNAKKKAAAAGSCASVSRSVASTYVQNPERRSLVKGPES